MITDQWSTVVRGTKIIHYITDSKKLSSYTFRTVFNFSSSCCSGTSLVLIDLDSLLSLSDRNFHSHTHKVISRWFLDRYDYLNRPQITSFYSSQQYFSFNFSVLVLAASFAWNRVGLYWGEITIAWHWIFVWSLGSNEACMTINQIVSRGGRLVSGWPFLAKFGETFRNVFWSIVASISLLH
jgi:hypothetical protein